MNLPLKTDLSGKVAVVTGAGGVLCSVFAKALAAAGAKVSLLNRTLANAEVVAEEIRADGGTAKAYQCNVLSKEDLERCRDEIIRDFGPCDILINGAGGNNARATTDKEYYEPGDLEAETKFFFDLDREGVFNLNFIGVLLTTQVFAQDMVDRPGCNILNISSMNAYTPLTKIPAYSGANPASRTPPCCGTRHGPLRSAGRTIRGAAVSSGQRRGGIHHRCGDPGGRRLQRLLGGVEHGVIYQGQDKR